MRRLRWTSSTTFVRRAEIVASRREMEVETSFSLAPRANVCGDDVSIFLNFG